MSSGSTSFATVGGRRPCRRPMGVVRNGASDTRSDDTRGSRVLSLPDWSIATGRGSCGVAPPSFSTASRPFAARTLSHPSSTRSATPRLELDEMLSNTRTTSPASKCPTCGQAILSTSLAAARAQRAQVRPDSLQCNRRRPSHTSGETNAP